MSWVKIAKIGKPHGFRGNFYARTDLGQDSAIGFVRNLMVGHDVDSLSPVTVKSSHWCPQGWRVRLAEWEEESDVKAHNGQFLFCRREDLPPEDEGEYYEADLQFCKAVDDHSGEEIGEFQYLDPDSGIEGSLQRWWFQLGKKTIGLPAHEKYIRKIDLKKKTISISDYEEFI